MKPLSVLALAVSIGLAILAQTILLRTRTAVPSVPLFFVACVIGGWVAIQGVPAGPALTLGSFPRLPRGYDWKVALALAVLCNAGCLVLFGRNTQPNMAWLLFAASIVGAAASLWLLDGRPGLEVNWRDERWWLVALGVLLVVGAGLRLIWLDQIPAGLWFDEAADTGLEIRHMLADPSYRPVFTLQPELWRYPALPAFVLFGANAFAIRLPHALAGIAGIAAIYLAGRELYGRKAGLIAAAILTALVWHLTFSRIAFSAVMSVTLDALAMFFFLRAVRTRSWLAAGLCGACLGMGVQVYYTSRFMALVLLFLLTVLWIRHPRVNLKGTAGLALPAILLALVCASPLLEYAIAHPAQFNARVSTLSVLNEVQSSHSIRPLTDNVRAHLLMFNLAGDRNGRHNLPGQPELNFLLAGLFVLGLGMVVARAKRPEFLVLLVWGAAMLAGGVLSVSFEAPQSLRTFDEVNVVALACALPLALLWDGLQQGLGSKRLANGAWLSVCGAAPVVALVGLSAYTDVDRYFQKQQRNPAVFSDSSGAPTLLARQANVLPAGTTVYMSDELVNQPTIGFLAPGVKQTPFNSSLLPLSDVKDTTIFLIGEEAPIIDVIRRYYPNAKVTSFTAPSGGPVLLYQVGIEGSMISATHGLEATYQGASGEIVQRRESTVDFTWNSLPVQFPFTATWTTALKAPEYGSYQLVLQGPPNADLQIDGKTPSPAGQRIAVQLAQGLHQLVLRAPIDTPNDKVQALWQPPHATSLEPLSNDALFMEPVEVNGLLGLYYRNDSWAGQPDLRRVDLQPAFRFHVPPLPIPFGVEWDARLTAPASGVYRFGTNAVDSSQLWIDDQFVLDNPRANEYAEIELPLNAGQHDIRLRYEARTRGFHVELYWQPPGLAREVIPAQFLLPSTT